MLLTATLKFYPIFNGEVASATPKAKITSGSLALQINFVF
jgi:hypothetical protein